MNAAGRARRFFAVATITLVIAFASLAAADDGQDVRQGAPQDVQKDSQKDVRKDLQQDDQSGLSYLEVMTGGAALSDPVPIVVAMHGLGDHPESFRLLLDDLPVAARVVFPRAPMPHGPDGFSWFDFQPDDDEGKAALRGEVEGAATRVSQLIGSLVRARGGPSRVVVCGFSQGGILSFALAAEHPELVSEAVPVSGYLPSPLWPAERPKFRPLPKILALHGETDRLIPLQWAKWSIEALRSNGYEVSLRSWPKVGHALPPEVHAALVAAIVGAVGDLAPAGPSSPKEDTGAHTPPAKDPAPGADAPPPIAPSAPAAPAEKPEPATP